MSATDTPNEPPGRAGRAGWHPFVLVLLVLAGGGAAGWWWQSAPGSGNERAAGTAAPAGDAPRGVPVGAATVEARNVPIWLNGLGTVQAYNTVVVRSRVDGEIVQIAFREGDTVQEGDVLARIDPRPYQAAYDAAVARKKQNEAQLVSGRQDLARTQALAKEAFAPQQQLDQRTAGVQAQLASIAADQAAIDNARTQLDYATIKAPLSGRLGLRLVDQGNIVRAGDQTGIVEIAQLQPIAVILTAPETELPAVIAAQRSGPVKVVATTSDNKTVLGTGELALINNSVDATSGTIRIKAVFPNTDGRMWPGLSVNTRLLLRTLDDVPTVPDDAIQRGQRDLFAFVVRDDRTVEKRPVGVEAFSDGVAVVKTGLKPGETVVTGGHSRLAEGSRVRVEGAVGGAGDGRDRRADADRTTVR